MTNEEAIKILSAWAKCNYKPTRDTAELAISAIHSRQTPAKLDRSRWEGCEHCKADREGYATCFKGANGRSVRMYIPEGEAAIVIPGKYNHKLCIPIRYCPYCGRPLTEEA